MSCLFIRLNQQFIISNLHLVLYLTLLLSFCGCCIIVFFGVNILLNLNWIWYKTGLNLDQVWVKNDQMKARGLKVLCQSFQSQLLPSLWYFFLTCFVLPSKTGGDRIDRRCMLRERSEARSGRSTSLWCNSVGLHWFCQVWERLLPESCITEGYTTVREYSHETFGGCFSQWLNLKP